MSNDHYFAASPKVESNPKRVSFEVAGVPFTLTSSSGTFSSNRLDKGTAVLLDCWESFPKSGKILDLGCGWGPIGISIAKLQSETVVTGVDINERSVALANQNAKELGLTNFAGVLAENLKDDSKFDEIWSNPPIRIGKQALHDLLARHLGQLVPGGKAMLVVQKQLGAPSLLKWLQENYPNWKIRKASSDRGFWVLEAISPPTLH